MGVFSERMQPVSLNADAYSVFSILWKNTRENNLEIFLGKKKKNLWRKGLFYISKFIQINFSMYKISTSRISFKQEVLHEWWSEEARI